MKYMGSKARIAKHILPIILKDRKDGQWYVEPFVGGANVIDKVDGNRIGADNNKYLIAMYQGCIDGRDRNIDTSKEHYSIVRNCYNKQCGTFDDFKVGLVGFMCSANGRFFEGGYSGISNTQSGKARNYINESMRGLDKQLPNLSDIKFVCSSYDNLEIPEKSVIYCDIPYHGSKKYPTSKSFDYERFWQWCREKCKEGHQVFISEYNAPGDFVCVWQHEVKSSLSANGKSGGSKVSIERLFVHKSQM
jgi:DNA adenine methylase